MMSSFDWGTTKWEVDKAADSLNTDLFGVMKTKKKFVTPDISVKTNNKGSTPDSDDEHLSKKGRKKMKEKLRKKKKKDNAHSPNNEKTNAAGGNETMKAKLNENISEEGERTKKKKKKNPPKSETLPLEKGDGGEMANLLIKENKQKKRKRSESDEVGIPKKKSRAAEAGISDKMEEPQVKKKRRNRKKKNNSKKNKYKHLALNAKSENDRSTGKPQNSEQNSIKDNKNVSKKMNNLQSQNSEQLSESAEKMDPMTNNEINLQGKKKKSKKRKADYITKETEVSKETLGNIETSNEVPLKSSSVKKRKSVDKDTGDTDYADVKMNGKSKNRLNKQTLKNMLGLALSKNGNIIDNQTEQSGVNIRDSKKIKGRKKKDKSMNDESILELHLNKSTDSDQDEKSPLSLDCKSPAEELKDRAREKLNAARFRFINEQLYTCKGHEALQLFRQDKNAFEVYHQGFQSQTTKWPVNPLDAIIKHIDNRPKQLVVADFGCGDARLSRRVQQKVHSFDLVALNDHVTACDMSKTPLPDDSIDIAVFCLSLMGTNLNDYVLEANRVLKAGGLLKIAEVSSRFHSPESFIKQISNLGFQLLNQRKLSEMFYMMDFKKSKRIKKSPSNVNIQLKPCFYKKR